MTAEEALAACLALGTDPETCRQRIESSRVNGAYCDGTIVYRLGEAPRCVPATVVRQRTAQASIPAREGASPEPGATLPRVLAVAAGIAIVILGGYAILRKS
jgi:hypothetical protein